MVHKEIKGEGRVRTRRQCSSQCEPTFTAPYVYEAGPIGPYDGYGLHHAAQINTPGTYYWRVRPRYTGDVLGQFSAPFVIRIDRTLPTRPVLLWPVVGAVFTNTHTPLVGWTA